MNSLKHEFDLNNI